MVHSTCIPAGHLAPALGLRVSSRLHLGIAAAGLLVMMAAHGHAHAHAHAHAGTPAKPPAKTARPDPLDPKASVPALRYESPIPATKRQGEDKPVSWREANDTVTRIGGWRVYAREAQQPDPAPAEKPATPASAAKTTEPAQPMPAGHGGHKKP